MKCPIDQTAMKKGYLRETGDLRTQWEPDGETVLGIFAKLKNLIAYGCPKCGKLELTTGE